MTETQRERRRKRRHPVTEIAIYSDIDSQTGFGPQDLREAMAEADGGPLTIRVNSEGGSVIDGLTCYNLLRGYEGETTVSIDGMALSIASLVVCGADKVQMAENAWMMVHNPHNQAQGDGDDMREMAGLLDGMKDQLVTVYSAKSKKSKEEITRLMDAETWMTGPEALAAGFIDEVTASLEVAATFDATRFSKPPTIPTKKEQHIMAEATFKELKTAFPRASADFIVRCQAKGHDLNAARAEFDEENAKAMEEKEKELAEAKAGFEEFQKETEAKAKAEEEEKKATEAKAKAEEEEEKKATEAKAKAGVRPAGGGATRSSGTASGFRNAVNEKMKLGLPRAQAVSETVHEEPELHREFVQGANAGR